MVLSAREPRPRNVFEHALCGLVLDALCQREAFSRLGSIVFGFRFHGPSQLDWLKRTQGQSSSRRTRPLRRQTCEALGRDGRTDLRLRPRPIVELTRYMPVESASVLAWTGPHAS